MLRRSISYDTPYFEVEIVAGGSRHVVRRRVLHRRVLHASQVALSARWAASSATLCRVHRCVLACLWWTTRWSTCLDGLTTAWAIMLTTAR